MAPPVAEPPARAPRACACAPGGGFEGWAPSRSGARPTSCPIRPTATSSSSGSPRRSSATGARPPCSAWIGSRTCRSRTWCACSRRRATRTTRPSRSATASCSRAAGRASPRSWRRLAREMGRIAEIDFFEAPGRREVGAGARSGRGAHRRRAGAAGGGGPARRSRRAQGPPLGHAPAPARGPHRLGVAHQALRGSGGRVRLRAARPDSRRRDPVRHGRRGLRASGRGLHVRDPAAPHRAPRPQARRSWPRSSTRPTSRTRSSRARKPAGSISRCARC